LARYDAENGNATKSDAECREDRYVSFYKNEPPKRKRLRMKLEFLQLNIIRRRVNSVSAIAVMERN